MLGEKKIAVVSTGYLPVPAIKGGAVEVLSQNIVDGFLENGNCVDVYTIRDENLEKYHEKLNIYQFSWGKLEFLFYRCMNYIFKKLKIDIRRFPYQVKVAKEIKKHEYDYIIVENNFLLYKIIYDEYHKKNRDVKFICHMHNVIYQLKNDAFYQKIYKFVAETADKIVVVSDFLKNEFLKCYPKEDNLKVLYNCVDFSIFNQENQDYTLKNKFDIKDDEFVYIFTGRMGEDKGIYELIKAFNLLNKEFCNIKLLIVGCKDGTYEKIENEITSNVIITGFIEAKNLAKYLNIADVAVFPSKWDEPFGVVALEAMATGKPIIATKSGGLVEVLDENCSILIDRDDKMVDNLYMAMKKMYLNKDFRVNCSKNAFEKVHKIKEFDKKYYFENFIKSIVD